ncbi:DnaD domain-containing protein [Lacticaseibacillus jixiensis]|uniref:DnaD domain-containing protein n=1 Tax=Lacticaseibacillus jixiensis TaxID=3231926 RepID=UPI0036F214E8
MSDALNSFMQTSQISFSDAVFAHYAQSDLTHSELIVYLFLSRWGQQHQEAPAPDALAQAVKMTPAAVYQTINSLLKKQAVALVSVQDNAGHSVDQYDVTPLLRRLLAAPQTTVVNTQQPDDDVTVFNQIEIEFGRPLSPIEQQTISDWLNIDHYDPAIILLALREAVINQKYSLRYIDRILIAWEKQHLTTPQQVRDYQERRNRL